MNAPTGKIDAQLRQRPSCRHQDRLSAQTQQNANSAREEGSPNCKGQSPTPTGLPLPRPGKQKGGAPLRQRRLWFRGLIPFGDPSPCCHAPFIRLTTA
jgi:hypothetical protein